MSKENENDDAGDNRAQEIREADDVADLFFDENMTAGESRLKFQALFDFDEAFFGEITICFFQRNGRRASGAKNISAEAVSQNTPMTVFELKRDSLTGHIFVTSKLDSSEICASTSKDTFEVALDHVTTDCSKESMRSAKLKDSKIPSVDVVGLQQRPSSPQQDRTSVFAKSPVQTSSLQVSNTNFEVSPKEDRCFSEEPTLQFPPMSLTCTAELQDPSGAQTKVETPKAQTTECLSKAQTEERFSEAKTDKYILKIHAEDYRSRAQTEEWLSEDPAEAYISEAEDEEYISEAKGEEYISEAQGEEYISEAQGEEYISEAQGEEYISEAQGEECISEAQGEEYISEAQGEEYLPVIQIVNYISVAEVDYCSEAQTDYSEAQAEYYSAESEGHSEAQAKCYSVAHAEEYTSGFEDEAYLSEFQAEETKTEECFSETQIDVGFPEAQTEESLSEAQTVGSVSEAQTDGLSENRMEVSLSGNETDERLSQGHIEESLSEAETEESLSQAETEESLSQAETEESLSQAETEESLSQAETEESLSQGHSVNFYSESEERLSEAETEERLSRGFLEVPLSETETVELLSEAQDKKCPSQKQTGEPSPQKPAKESSSKDCQDDFTFEARIKYILNDLDKLSFLCDLDNFSFLNYLKKFRKEGAGVVSWAKDPAEKFPGTTLTKYLTEKLLRKAGSNTSEMVHSAKTNYPTYSLVDGDPESSITFKDFGTADVQFAESQEDPILPPVPRQPSLASTAAQRYYSGDLISQFPPFVHVLYERKIKTRCSFCFERLTARKKVCGVCTYAYYCNRHCQFLHIEIHKMECFGLRKCETKYPSADVRAMAHLIWKLQEPKSHGIYDTVAGKRYRYRNLDSYETRIKNHPLYEPCLLQQYEGLQDFLGRQFISFENFSTLFAKFNKHKMVITGPDDEKLGIGMYLGLAGFEHSCRPNANVVFLGTSAQILACSEFQAGDPHTVTLRFVPSMSPRDIRHHGLLIFNGGICKCKLCQNEEFEAKINKVACRDEEEYGIMDTILLSLNGLDTNHSREDAYDDRERKNIACRNLKLMSNVAGEMNYVRGRMLEVAADSSRKLQQFEEAVHYYEELVEIHKYILGPRDVKTMNSMLHLGLSHYEAGHPREAKSCFNEGLQAAYYIYGYQHPFFRRIRHRFIQMDNCNWEKDKSS